MLTQMRKTLREDEAGQALVLGAVSMLILALSVMVTIQLGHTIHERIQLQNASDNAAYSTAAVVARSLNFIAWVNRATVSQYVSMMAATSISSFLTGIQTLLWMLADLVQSVAAVACVVEKACEKCMPFPACVVCFGVFLAIHLLCEGISVGLFAVLNGTWQAIDFLDRATAGFVKAVSWLNNNGMYYAQKGVRHAVGLVLTGNLAGTFQEKLLNETAGGNVNTGTTGNIYKGAMSLFNGEFGPFASYPKIFDDYSEDIPDGGTEYDGQSYNDHSGVQKAERLMAEIANATRLGTGQNGFANGVTFETNRGWSDSEGFVATVLKFIGFEFAGSTRLVGVMDPRRFTQNGVGVGFGGSGDSAFEDQTERCQEQSEDCSECQNDHADDPSACDGICGQAERTCKKLEDMATSTGGGGQSNPTGGNDQNIFNHGAYGSTQMTQGGALAAAERVKATGLSLISGGGARIVGIQAWRDSDDENKSFHCRLKDDESDRHREITLMSGCPKYAWTKGISCENEDGRHEWYGVGRYISFRAENKDSTKFNQPYFWSFANKEPQNARLPADLAFGFDSSGKMTWGDYAENGAVTFEPKPGLDIQLLAGLNAYSRSQVYYHRPGFWAEPPNLFNPFWKPKLSPVGPAIGQIFSQVGLSDGTLTDLATHVVTH